MLSVNAISSGEAPRYWAAAAGTAVVELTLVHAEVCVGVGVEAGSVPGDRCSHRPRVSGQHERREVGDLGSQLELRPHRLPVVRIQLTSAIAAALTTAAASRRPGGSESRADERPTSQRHQMLAQVTNR